MGQFAGLTHGKSTKNDGNVCYLVNRSYKYYLLITEFTQAEYFCVIQSFQTSLTPLLTKGGGTTPPLKRGGLGVGLPIQLKLFTIFRV